MTESSAPEQYLKSNHEKNDTKECETSATFSECVLVIKP